MSRVDIQPSATMLTRGTTNRVAIKLTVDKPLKVRGIRASYFGAEESKADYTTTSTDSEGKTITEHHTAVEHQSIVTRDWLLHGNAKQGFFSTISDAVATMFGGGKHEVMSPGEYTYDVELDLPADAPPTHVGQKSRVFYELSVVVDVPLGRDLTARHGFTVEPPVGELPESQPLRLQFPGAEGRGLFDKAFTPDVRIDLAVASDSYCAEETIEGMFRIDVAKPTKCRAIRARLIGLESSTAHGHQDSYTHVGEPTEIARPGELTGTFQQEFTLPARVTGPLTSRGKCYSIDWYLQVELDVPWAKDPTIRAPLALLPSRQVASPNSQLG